MRPFFSTLGGEVEEERGQGNKEGTTESKRAAEGDL